MESSSTDYENLENTANDSENINIHEDFQCEGQVYTVQVADLKRLESWILALKLRYWIDFGNRSQYNVDWLRKLDDKGDLAGIRIKLSKRVMRIAKASCCSQYLFACIRRSYPLKANTGIYGNQMNLRNFNALFPNYLHSVQPRIINQFARCIIRRSVKRTQNTI